MRVRYRTVLITDGSADLGLARSDVLLEQGNQVLAASCSTERLRAATERLPRLHTGAGDVTRERAPRNLTVVARVRLGRR